MAIQTNLSVISAADQLQERLQAANTTFQQLSPQEQTQKFLTFLDDAAELTQLQDKVNRTCSGAMNLLPGVTDDEILALSLTLHEANSVIEVVQANYDIACDILELTNDVQSVFSNANPGNIPAQQIQSLQGRLTALTSDAHINWGNKKAGQELQAMIQAYQQPTHHTQAIQAPLSNRDLMAEQNESFEIAQLMDRFATLNSSLEQNTVNDFEAVLKFYVVIKESYSKHGSFILSENNTKFENLIRQAEGLLLAIINKQKEIETLPKQGNAPVVLQGLQIGNAPAYDCLPLQNFKFGVDIACNQLRASNSDRIAIEKMVQEALSKISPEDKEKLFTVVSSALVQDKTNTKALPLTLLNQPFSAWKANCFHLQTALEKLLSSPAPIQAPVPVIATQAVGSPAMQNLNKALKVACDEIKKVQFNALAVKKDVDEAFGKLSADERGQLFKAMSDVLITENQRTTPLPASLEKMAFATWSASYPYRLKTVEKLLSCSAPQAPAPVAAPAVLKLSQEMYSRVLEAQARFAARQMMPSQTPMQARQTNTPSQTPPANRTNPSAFGGVLLEGYDEDLFNTVSYISIKKLLLVLNHLGPNASYNDLQNALSGLTVFESLGHKVPFKISGNAPTLVADRPCFHLYFIHKNESPQNLVQDMQYGSKAMAGAYPASNEERMRAIQRTIMELVLEGMEDAINFGDVGQAKDLIEIAQKLHPQLNPKDLPDLTSVDVFQMVNLGMIGNAISSGNISAIDTESLIKAIGQIRNILKQVWKL